MFSKELKWKNVMLHKQQLANYKQNLFNQHSAGTEILKY